MSTSDREVLEFVGPNGKWLEEVEHRFPGFDMLRLVRAGFVEERMQDPDTVAHTVQARERARLRYGLTERGAAAVGLGEPAP